MKNILFYLLLPIIIPILLLADWFGRNYVGEYFDLEDLEPTKPEDKETPEEWQNRHFPKDLE